MNRFRRIVAVTALAVGVSLPMLPSAPASAAAPTFADGNGIHVVSQSVQGREIDLQVTTTAVSGQHEVIVLLPEGYSDHPDARYPTLYLFHGALAGPSAWTSGSSACSSGP